MVVAAASLSNDPPGSTSATSGRKTGAALRSSLEAVKAPRRKWRVFTHGCAAFLAVNSAPAQGPHARGPHCTLSTLVAR